MCGSWRRWLWREQAILRERRSWPPNSTRLSIAVFFEVRYYRFDFFLGERFPPVPRQ